MKRKNVRVRFPAAVRNLLVLPVLAAVPVMASETGPAAPSLVSYLTLPRIWIGFLFALTGLVLLIRRRATKKARTFILPVIFIVFGVTGVLPLGDFARGMGMHPSPICITTKPFLFIHAGLAVPVIMIALLTFVAVINILGNKLFCGWVCPVGAIQEWIHQIPLPGKLKRKLPFRWTQPIRIGIFLLFIMLVFTAGMEIYEYFNPFEFLHWGFPLFGSVAMIAVLTAALFIFRPFCYLVCPLGLVTWLLEQISIFRVQLDRETCTDCGVCTGESPCPSVPAILEKKKIRPDCHACGRCIEVCPEHSLSFRMRFRR